MKIESILDPKAEFLQFLAELRRQSPEVVQKNKRFLDKIEAELGCSLLDVPRASMLEKAIKAAAAHRKVTYNGGWQDDGTGYRFRLGQAAVCYLRWAHGEALIERNPYPKNSFPQAPTQKAHWLTPEETKVLFKASSRFKLRDRLLIHFLYDTGLRVSEACRVKLSDIDWKERIVQVKMTKVNREKTPPLTVKTMHILKDYLASRGRTSDFLFENPSGGPLTTKAVRRAFQFVISKEVGFRVNPHCLRHTAGTAWVEAAGQIHAMQFLGHTDVKMTNHYTHLSPRALRKTQKLVAARLKVA